MKLSPHFELDEMINTSYTGCKTSQKEDVKPYIDNLHILCNYILEPIRAYYGKPITITSGFRGKTLNAKVGGNVNSDHCRGIAADLIIKGKTVDQIFNDIKNGKINICYRQMIKEIINGKEWLHIAALRMPYDDKDKYMQKLTTKDGKNFIEVK